MTELLLLVGCVIGLIVVFSQPWSKPTGSCEVVYGETALNGKIEMSRLKRRHLDQQSRFRNATSDVERQAAYDAMTSIENEFDALELKYFGPKVKGAK